MAKKRNEGYYLRVVSLKIEKTSARQSKGCEICGRAPVGKRLVFTKGSGRYAKSVIRCQEHGTDLIKELIKDLKKAHKDLHAEEVL